MKKNLLYWVFPLFIMIAIFLFSSQPADISTTASQTVGELLLAPLRQIATSLGKDLSSLPTAESIDFFVRKAAHFFIYASLGASLYFATFKTFQKFHGASSALISLLYAASDELHQHFVPGRSAQITDVLLDFSGSLFGLLLLFLFLKIYPLNRSR